MSELYSVEGGAASDAQAAAHAQVIRLAGGYVFARAVHALAQLGVADHLADGPLSAEELARAAGAHAPSLYRLLRSTAALGFFEEDADRRFSLTPLGSALRTGAPGHARSAVRTLGAEGMWRAFGEFLDSVRTGEAALKRRRGRVPFYDPGGSPERAALLNETMIGFHGAEPPAVAAAYDFAGVGKLVDVGGGMGGLLTTILLANPGLSGLLYDLPHVVAEARPQIEAKGLSGRCEVLGGDFFESVPAGGDAYLLSHVVYDWEDERCLQLLGNCRRAMRGRGRLLVVDPVIAPGNDFHEGKFIDLILLATTGGKVRTEEEHAALLARAGFRLTRVVKTLSPVSVVEAVPA